MKRNRFLILFCIGILAFLRLSEKPVWALVNCGATLTTDTTLTSTDPVVFDPVSQSGDTPCTGTALILGDAITLDCAGLTLKGKGSGFGIKVARGVEGATILNCVVDGFRTGIELGGLGSHIVDTTVVSACRETSVEFSRIFQNLVEIKLRVL